MAALSDSDAGTLAESGAPSPATGIGICRFCGLELHYAGAGPGTDAWAEADQDDFYDETWAPFRDYQLLDSTGSLRCTGTGALAEPAVAIGQFPHHEL